jgi:hypothetical protein
MFAKALAGIVMAIVASALSHLVAGVAMGGAASDGRTGWAALAGFVVVLVLAITAARGRDAWGRGLLISGLLCLLMAIAVSGIFQTHEVERQATEAGRVGSAVVLVMAGTLFTGVFAVLGYFLGLVFLIGSYFALRKT